MRHSIRPTFCPRGPNARRVAAAAHALQRERNRLALFASQVLDEQQTPEERIRRQDEQALAHEQRHRALAAEQWRQGRKLLMEAPQAARDEISAAWNRSSIPAEAAYFADFVSRALREQGFPPITQEDRA